MQIESVVIGVILFIAALIIIFLVLSVVNYFLKPDNSDQEEKSADTEQITLEDRLESLRKFAGGMGSDSQFHRLSQADLELPDNISRRAMVYESVGNEPRFLILPTSYVITRSEEASPLLKMVATLDAEESEENKVVFKFTVAPNLLPYHMAYLQSAIKEYFDAQSNSQQRDEDPDIYLPTDISEAPEVVWKNAFTYLDSYTTEGKFLIIWIETESVTEAAAAARLFRPDPTHQGLHGKVRFPLKEGQTVQTSILANLDNAIGEAISKEPGKKDHSVSILNRTESPIQIKNLMVFRKDASEPDIRNIDPPKTVRPGNRAILPIPKHTDKVLADYQVEVSQEKDLSELRVDVGELEFLLAIDTDIQPHETFKLVSDQNAELLSAIRIVIDWEERVPVTRNLMPNEGSKEGFSRAKVPIIVPLDRYLEPQKRTLQYQVTFEFKNGTQLTTDMLKHNYSDTRLTIRRQLLRELLPEFKDEEDS